MQDWTPYNDMMTAEYGADLRVADVAGAPFETNGGPDIFATGRYEAAVLRPHLQMISCDLVTTAAFRSEAELAPSLCIALPLAGSWDSRVAGHEIAMAAGQGPVVFGFGGAAEVAEQQLPGQRIAMHALYIGGALLEEDDPDLAGLARMMRQGWFCHQLAAQGKIARHLTGFGDCPYQGRLRQWYLEGLALHVLVALAEEFGRLPVMPRARQLARDLRDRLDRQAPPLPPVAVLAAGLGSNETSLRRAFRAEFGIGITEYYRRRLLEEARALLQSGAVQVAGAGWRAGYASPENFTHAYRRHFGHPPVMDLPQNRRS